MITIVIGAVSTICNGQSIDNMIIKGSFTSQDSILITSAYLNANQAVQHMYNAVKSIWEIEGEQEKSTKSQRKERWQNDETFVKWLGQPRNIGMAYRKIRKIHSKFNGKFILEVTKEDKGRCNRWVGAWAAPYGNVKITLCRNFFNVNALLSGKFLIHELGHEAGMLSHRKIYSCQAAIIAASSNENNRSLQNPENYAWLAMSYLGLECYK
ncbi:MAG: hypothetical protein O2951_07865 [Bacteroidetes bacterium]|nr:hypothetical protein [Bacteroidota bacterium]